MTDGEREARLSSVSRTVSRRRLENRLGPLRERANRTVEPSPLRPNRAARESTGSPSARGRAPQTRSRGRPRKHQVSRTSNQIRSRRTHVLGKGAARGGPVPKGSALLASRIARGSLTALGAGGQPDTDVERQLPRRLGRAALLVARTASARRGAGGHPRGAPWGERQHLHATAVPRRADAPRSGRPPRRPAGRAGGPAGRARRPSGDGSPASRPDHGRASSARSRVEAGASRTAQRASARAAHESGRSREHSDVSMSIRGRLASGSRGSPRGRGLTRQHER